MIEIKVKTLPYQREIIEERFKHLEKSLLKAKEDYDKEVQKINNLISTEKKFWAENTCPIEDSYVENKRRIKEEKAYVVRTKIVDSGTVNTSCYKLQKVVCIYCGKEPLTFYLSCSDSRYDERHQVCDCSGAKKNGKPFSKIKKEY
jgi:hypothetical protein